MLGTWGERREKDRGGGIRGAQAAAGRSPSPTSSIPGPAVRGAVGGKERERGRERDREREGGTGWGARSPKLPTPGPVVSGAEGKREGRKGQGEEEGEGEGC